MSTTVSPIELKLKKIKEKKQRANSVSSLNTKNSTKQRAEKTKRLTINQISNIKKDQKTAIKSTTNEAALEIQQSFVA
jgi:hypothetical protein